jgi:hypothetical protein
MADGEKKGLFGRLFRRKGQADEQDAPQTTPEDVKEQEVAVESSVPEEQISEQDTAQASGPHESEGAEASALRTKTDIVELEMDIPEEEISTVALSLDDLDADHSGEDPPPAGRQEAQDYQSEGPAGSQEDIELETAEFEGATEIKLDSDDLKAVTSEEIPGPDQDPVEEASKPDEPDRTATIPPTLQDVEADLAGEDGDVLGSDIELDLDVDDEEDMDPLAASQPEADEPAVPEQPSAQPESAATEEVPDKTPTAAMEEPSIQVELPVSTIVPEEPEEDEKQDQELELEVESDDALAAVTSSEVAGQYGFPEYVQPEEAVQMASGEASSGGEPAALQEVSGTVVPIRTQGLRGVSDSPLAAAEADNEALGIQNHVTAVSTFIMNCRAPMNIAIHGDPGSGKTTFMNLIEADLDKAVYMTIRFDPRDYARFGNAEEVPALLIRRFVAEIRNCVPHNDDVVAIDRMINDVDSFLNSIWRVGYTVNAEAVKPEEVDEVADASLSKRENDSVAGLKKRLREIVENALQHGAKEKVVVFIDNLHRIDSGMALDILETVTTFLSIDQCVVVTACDVDAIRQGLNSTFQPDADPEIVRSEFERFFQLVINLPRRATRIRDFIRAQLESAHFDSSEQTLESCLRLLKHSVGYNPRKIKRLTNRLVYAHALSPELCSSGDSGPVPHSRNQRLLFGLGCLDAEFGPLFQLLQNLRHDEKALMHLIDNRLRELERVRELLSDAPDNDERAEKLLTFIDLFAEILLEGDANRRLDREDLILLRQLIDLMSLTAATTTERLDIDGKHLAYTEFCTRVKNRLSRMLPESAPDGSDKFIRSRYSSRPWFGLWYTDTTTKKIWGQRRLAYEISFDVENRDAVAVSLKCNAPALREFNVTPKSMDRLRKLPTLEEKHFRTKDYDSGWLEIVKMLHECSCGHIDDISDDEVESVAEEMKELILATHHLFDPPPRPKPLQLKRAAVPEKRPIPPCKVCGSELKQVTTKDGAVGFKCDTCRKIFKPKGTP